MLDWSWHTYLMLMPPCFVTFTIWAFILHTVQALHSNSVVLCQYLIIDNIQWAISACSNNLLCLDLFMRGMCLVNSLLGKPEK